jgi:ribosomal protein S18 acetylase RimI-like enzyme
VSRHPWKEKHRAAIGIALVREARGKGIGRVLMRDAMELATKRMHGLESFDLSVLDYNETAQSLYKSLGFTEVGCVPRSMKEEDEYFDERIMVRFLKKGGGKRRRKRV